ncbi:MAG: class I SAM-dependent methyltransferase [Pirellulaceae bacterium]
MTTTGKMSVVLTQYRRQLDANWMFFRGFLQKPCQVASVVPSSRYLERRLVRLARAQEANCVVELGAGTGGTTRALLDVLPPAASLLSIELNSEFMPLLRQVEDRRLIVHEGRAEHFRDVLASQALPAPDVVVSGVPFSLLKPHAARELVEDVYQCLAPGGRFLAYQWQTRVRDIGCQVFGPCRTVHEFLNFPPLRIFVWRKVPHQHLRAS